MVLLCRVPACPENTLPSRAPAGRAQLTPSCSDVELPGSDIKLAKVRAALAHTGC